MEYHEFVCDGASALFVVTADPDPEKIPAAAQRCCTKWVYSRAFRLGDGTHTPAVEGSIKVRVASEGYHLFLKRPC